MTQWEDRLREHKQKLENEEATRESYEQATAAKAALLPQQQEFSMEIANNAVCFVLRTVGEIMTDNSLSPVIEKHGARTVGIVEHVGDIRIAVNIHARADGRVGVNVFGGLKDTLDEKVFDLGTDIEEIRDWFGNTIARYHNL